jgi:hypothetical protein
MVFLALIGHSCLYASTLRASLQLSGRDQFVCKKSSSFKHNYLLYCYLTTDETSLCQRLIQIRFLACNPSSLLFVHVNCIKYAVCKDAPLR